jgi:hypothetical protein
VAVLLAWSIFNLFDYGAVHLLTRPSRTLALVPTAHHLEAWMVCLGAVAPFSILFLAAPSWRVGLAALTVTAVLLLVHPVRTPAGIPSAQTLGWLFRLNAILVAVWTVAAIIGSRARTSEDKLLLAGWIVGGAGFVVLFAQFMAVRHVLLVMPAILLALGLALEGRDTRVWMPVACALSILLGGVLALSDWTYAEMYRTQARELRERLEAGGDLWYLGNWGWRWYAEAEGMKPYLPGRSRLGKGDTVIVAVLPAGPKQLAEGDRARAERLETVRVPASGAVLVRTMARRPLGGYYAMGRLPWHISRAPLDRFRFFRIVRD